MNKKKMQPAQSKSGKGPLMANIPIAKQLVITMAKPSDQANFFGAASTHSGLWGRTIQLAIIKLGTHLVLTNRRRYMSIMKVMPNARSGW